MLQLVTLLRSMCQSMALVCVSLYLKDLGWSGTAIGALLAAAGICRTILTVFVRELNALLGAKRYLLLFEAIAAVGSVIAAVCPNPVLLGIAIVAAGFGIGHSGSGGPAAPIERRWLAAYSGSGADTGRMQRLFGINALLGFAGMGAGALLACLPELWSGYLPGANAYKPVFALMALLAVGCLLLLARTKGGKRRTAPAAAQPQTHTEASSRAPRSDSKKLLLLVAAGLLTFAATGILRRAGLHQAALYVPVVLLAAVVGAPHAKLLFRKKSGARKMTEKDLTHLASMLGGITTTLSSTMTSYWLAAKFGASPGSIGAVMGISFLAAGLLSFLSASRAPAVPTLIAMQTLAILFILALPWAPSFWSAALLEIGCTACNLGTRSNRSAVMMEEAAGGGGWTWASRASYLIARLGAVMWPGAFGAFIDEGQYVVPFSIAAAIQSGATLLYARIYRPRSRDRRGSNETTTG
jgi:MFS family permease